MTKAGVPALTLMLALAATACGGAATTASSPTPSATATPATATPATATPATATPATPTPTASVPAKTPEPTPVVLTVSGRATRASDGAPVPGVRLRFSPFTINDGRVAGADVVVTSDASGAYSAKVPAWTLEALANSSSSQLGLFLTPPVGMKVVALTRSSTLPIGPIAPNHPEWYFMLARDLDGPVDITLAAQ